MSMVKILLCQLMRKLNYVQTIIMLHQKLINESSILNFKTDVPSVILRMPGIYGSPNDNVSIIGRFTEAIKNNHEIQINGTGAQLRDYIYIEDILKAIELISNNPKIWYLQFCYRLFNINILNYKFNFIFNWYKTSNYL